MNYKKIIIFSDGGARNNPGPGAGGSVIFFDEEKRLISLGGYYGKVTNNQAEYRALVEAVNFIIEKQVDDSVAEVALEIYLDSELMVRQLNGQYQVRNSGLKEYYDELQLKFSQFAQVDVNHVLRANNKIADSIVNVVLDRWQDKE